MIATMRIGVTGYPRNYRARVEACSSSMERGLLCMGGDGRDLRLRMSEEEMEWLGHLLLAEVAKRRVGCK